MLPVHFISIVRADVRTPADPRLENVDAASHPLPLPRLNHHPVLFPQPFPSFSSFLPPTLLLRAICEFLEYIHDRLKIFVWHMHRWIIIQTEHDLLVDYSLHNKSINQ